MNDEKYLVSVDKVEGSDERIYTFSDSTGTIEIIAMSLPEALEKLYNNGGNNV